jgi:hypothetical protein
MKKILFIIILISLNFYFSQNIEIERKVKSNNNQKLEFVNIGIFKKNIGTISDENGLFTITFDKSFLKDSLTFSYVGYENLSIKIEDIRLTNQKEFILIEQPTVLKEVLISSKKLKIKKLGTTSYVSMVAGYVWSKENLNRDILEHAKFLNIKKPSKILNLNLNLFNVIADSTMFRLNFYSIKDNLPDKKINTENIVLNRKIVNGWNQFDLSEFDLKFDKPVFITFEYIPKSKTEREPYRLSGQFLGKSIKRTSSLGTWEVNKGLSMAMYAEIEQ